METRWVVSRDMSPEEHFSLHAMVLTMAVRRGIVSERNLTVLSAEAKKYFENNPGSVSAAWAAFDTAEKSREAATRKMPNGDSSAYIEVTVDKKIVTLESGYAVLILRDKASGSAVPILIGFLEASMIWVEFGDVVSDRPLTPDLVKNILIDQFGAAVTKVVLAELRERTMYALLHIEKDGSTTTHDCRPSDAIAIALRFGVFYLTRSRRTCLRSNPVLPSRYS